MGRTIAMILAGGRVDELSVLTLKRPKSAVPYGGIYRIIDFSLTNLMRSGIDQIGILSQYRLGSLMDHVGLGQPWDLHGRRRGVHILPPYLVAGKADWYRGTADAVYQNIHFINNHRPDNVMILSGDHVYQMDYGPMLAFHEERGADLTMAVKPVQIETASRFGICELDGSGRVVSYDEKPRKPRSNLASLTIYIFRTEVLMERLMQNANSGRTHQLYDEVIPRMVQDSGVYGYVYDGYWKYARTIDEYYEAQMDLVCKDSPVCLDGWKVRTNIDSGPRGDLIPARLLSGCDVHSSIIPGGCVIEGEVSGSVISPRVVIGKGARVIDSVIMHDTVIEPGAVVQRAIIDKHVKIGAGARIGTGKKAKPNKEVPHSLASGITVVGRETHIPAKAKIGANCLVYPDLTTLGRATVADGSTVK